MPDIRPVLYVIGILLCLTSGAMLLPMILDLISSNNDWKVFLITSTITFFIGMICVFAFNEDSKKITIREGFILTVLSWIVVAIFAAIPFIYSETNLSITNAFF